MIIRENGIVVGMLDDQSLKLTEATSPKLIELIEDLRKNGMFRHAPDAEPLAKGVDSSDAGITLPFTAENIDFIETDILQAGYEVQTA